MFVYIIEGSIILYEVVADFPFQPSKVALNREKVSDACAARRIFSPAIGAQTVEKASSSRAHLNPIIFHDVIYLH
jgi:hypothetical protein